MEFTELKELENLNEFTMEEQAYRRGYSQGVLAKTNNPELTIEEVYHWRNSEEQTAPPGSCFSGMQIQGLTKADSHRFFINKLKPKNR